MWGLFQSVLFVKCVFCSFLMNFCALDPKAVTASNPKVWFLDNDRLGIYLTVTLFLRSWPSRLCKKKKKSSSSNILFFTSKHFVCLFIYSFAHSFIHSDTLQPKPTKLQVTSSPLPWHINVVGCDPFCPHSLVFILDQVKINAVSVEINAVTVVSGKY